KAIEVAAMTETEVAVEKASFNCICVLMEIATIVDRQASLKGSFGITDRNELYLNLVLEYVPETTYRVTRHYSKANQRMPMIYVKLYTYQRLNKASTKYVFPCFWDPRTATLLISVLTRLQPSMFFHASGIQGQQHCGCGDDVVLVVVEDVVLKKTSPKELNEARLILRLLDRGELITIRRLEANTILLSLQQQISYMYMSTVK
ncbi:hypothetical protein Tco_1434582, partial [Tanacetum coccineum]